MKNILLVTTIIAALIGGALVKSVLVVSDEDFHEKLVETSNDLNKNLPMLVDHETRLDTTSVGPGNRLTYSYSLVTLSINEIDTPTLVGLMRPQLIHNYRTNPEMAEFRRRDVELVYQYRDKLGNTVTTIAISPKDF